MFTHKGIDELSSELQQMKRTIELKQKLLTDLLGIYKWIKFTLSVDTKEDITTYVIYLCPDVVISQELQDIFTEEGYEIYVYGRDWDENIYYLAVTNFLKSLTEHIDYVMLKE